jgi:N-acetylglucosaminyldiphosphoundecaprenol N-acetyl-beta-D-mannosaminyltransferase
MNELPIIQLRGTTLHAITQAQCVAHLFDRLDEGRGGFVVTPNLDHLRRLERDAEFRELCDRADLRVADGMPLLWAARFAGKPLPERVAGSDLIWSVSETAARRGRSIYLLGGDPGTAKAAAAELRRRYAGLKIAGWHYPPPGFERDSAAINRLRCELESVEPDIVFVALGSPKQERLIDALRPTLSRAWWLGVGISFSFVCGEVKRAPVWMRRGGLEWLHRLAQEPKRLAGRYLLHGLPFAGKLLAGSLLSRIRDSGGSGNSGGPGDVESARLKGER